MLKVTCLKVANEISSLQFKLAPSAWCEISLVISIHVIFLHLAYVDNQPEIQRISLAFESSYSVLCTCPHFQSLARAQYGLRKIRTQEKSAVDCIAVCVSEVLIFLGI